MDQSIIYVESSKVSCEGPYDSLGHPQIYLNLNKKGNIICPYCSQQFILKQASSKEE